MNSTNWEMMRSDAARQTPMEACGMLGGEILGSIFRTKVVIPATNILRSPVSFQIDPQEQLQAFKHFDEHGWDLVGVYHSHPLGPELPSPTDVTQAYYPEVAHLIWSKKIGQWECRGFLIQNSSIQEIALQING
jgi:proteasome lid subunit RPN8/RPN11